MKIVLATGIYPPEIGGPATYVERLGKELLERGVRVTIIAYGDAGRVSDASSDSGRLPGCPVIRVSRTGGPLLRWRRYAKALREHASDADIVYCFSSVSTGVPLWLAKLRSPKTILRLGGDFLWERYTDRGGICGLREWYEGDPPFKGMMHGLLKQFDYIVFSTAFQEELYERSYGRLPQHGVIENALPTGLPVHHAPHDPFRLLFLGRYVPFKNIASLISALRDLPDCTLTLAGDGPLAAELPRLVARYALEDRVRFLPPCSGDGKQQLFLDHDALVLPSFTEISPNTALEARAAGLPVLLTEETGLSRTLTDGAHIRPLKSPRQIASAVHDMRQSYEMIADRASAPPPGRGWDAIADEHLRLFRNLL